MIDDNLNVDKRIKTINATYNQLLDLAQVGFSFLFDPMFRFHHHQLRFDPNIFNSRNDIPCWKTRFGSSDSIVNVKTSRNGSKTKRSFYDQKIKPIRLKQLNENTKYEFVKLPVCCTGWLRNMSQIHIHSRGYICTSFRTILFVSLCCKLKKHCFLAEISNRPICQ